MCPHGFGLGAFSFLPLSATVLPARVHIPHAAPEEKARAQKQHPPTKRRPEAARGHGPFKHGSPGPIPPFQDPRPQLPSGAVLPAGAHSFIWPATGQKTRFLNSKNKAQRPENNCSDFLALMKCIPFDTDRLFNYMRDFFSLALLPH